MTTIFARLGADIQTEIGNLEKFFATDVWPYVQEFLAMLATQTGKDALKAAVAAIPEAATGNVSAAAAYVGAAVAASLAANAAADLKTVLTQASNGIPAN